MSGLGFVFSAGVVVSLGAVGAIDAKTKTISLPWLGCLLVAGLAWLVVGGGLELVGHGSWMHVLGAVVGCGIPISLILAAELVGRRWPIFPGDALLLGAIGMILGLRIFLWALALGAFLAIGHRICLQTRRGRPVLAGYLAAGPGLAAGAAAIFIAVNGGVAFAETKTVGAGGDREEIAATELLLVKSRLPEEIADREIVVRAASPLPFPTLAARIGEAAGVSVVIEERPSRVSGGRAELGEPEPLLPGVETRLVSVLDDVATRARYAWEWRDNSVVFYRYWDRGWRGVELVEREVSEDPLEQLVSWLGRVFSGESDEAGVSASGREVKGDARPGGVSGAESGSKNLAGEPVESQETADGMKAPKGGVVKSGDTPAGGSDEPVAVEKKALVWVVDPAGQKTLKGVLEAWAKQAEWTVAWKARQDFSVGAGATFEGEFLEAVDSLLSDPQVSRVLSVSAHANRYLVVKEAGR